MPQMSPLSWIFIFLFLFFLVLNLMSSMPNISLPVNKKLFMKKKNNSLKW